MMPKLKYENGFMSRDLTYREWPWQCWIASLSKEDMMVEAIGSGIYEFYVETRSELRCPYSGTPQANFVAVQKDGTRVWLHPHQQKDEPLRFENQRRVFQHRYEEPTGDDINRAFRIASGWSCRGRWLHSQVGVFNECRIPNPQRNRQHLPRLKPNPNKTFLERNQIQTQTTLSA